MQLMRNVILSSFLTFFNQVQVRGLKSLSVISWNINGLRSLLKHDTDGRVIRALVESKKPHFICLQETKLQEHHTEVVEKQLRSILGHNYKIRCFWNSSRARKGYSGTAIICIDRDENLLDDIEVSYGIGDKIGDMEGRSITVQSADFSLTNVYVPNSGSSLDRLGYRTEQWDASLCEYMSSLRSATDGRTFVLTGDLNVAHRNIDYYNPNSPWMKKQAGTTPQEQASFYEKFLEDGFFIDSFRECFPDEKSYSYYSSRKGMDGKRRKEGLRIDYLLVGSPANPTYAQDIISNNIPLPYIIEDIWSPYSDHCPIGAHVLLPEKK